MNKKLLSYINKRKELIEIERKEEKKFHLEEIYNLWKNREKVKRTVCNLQWKQIKSYDDIALIKFWKKKDFKTNIKEGDIVCILPDFVYKKKDFKSFEKELEKLPIWNVEYVWKQFINVYVEKPIPDWVWKKQVDISLFINDITFKRQQDALDRLWKKKDFDHIKDVLFWKQLHKEKKQELDNLDTLSELLVKYNEYQVDFIEKSLTFKDFLILHGPFWTWKTTTLIWVLKQLYEKKENIIVSADSNIAVDNILESLVKKESIPYKNIVRIWPFTKLIDKKLWKYSIYNQLEEHKDYQEVRHIEQQIQKLQKEKEQFTKPQPSTRRGLTNEQIHNLAWTEQSYRWIKNKLLKSMSLYIKHQEQIKSLIDEKETIKDDIKKDIIENASIIICTNSMIFSNMLKEHNFDTAIIDEWSQATVPSTLLSIVNAKKFIIAWDHRQLPPTVLSKQAKELEHSLFEQLVKNYEDDEFRYNLLWTQYRMNKTLMQFPNKMFYKWKIQAEFENIKLKDLVWEKTWRYLNTNECLYFFNTKGEQNLEKNSKSLYNLEEIEKVKELVQELQNFGIDDIGIISPYSEQVNKLKKEIDDVDINTIDGFQWMEKEVIIISWVRTEGIWFLEDERRFNVAITRTKRMLINIWDSKNLEQKQLFKEYTNYIKWNWKFIG